MIYNILVWLTLLATVYYVGCFILFLGAQNIGENLARKLLRIGEIIFVLLMAIMALGLVFRGFGIWV